MCISFATTLKKSKFLCSNFEEHNHSLFSIPWCSLPWLEQWSILWLIDIFPEEIEWILLDCRYDTEDVYDALGDSDNEKLPGE